MFTQKALLTKWGLYSAAVLLFLVLQQFLSGLSPLIGIVPFLIPIIVAVVSALEGPIAGTIFGTVIGFLCDLYGGGVVSGIYTISFFVIALVISLISRYYVMHNVFGSLIYALIAFLILDSIQALAALLWKGAALSALVPLIGGEIAASILFTIPIFFVFRYLNRLFRYE